MSIIKGNYRIVKEYQITIPVSGKCKLFDATTITEPGFNRQYSQVTFANAESGNDPMWIAGRTSRMIYLIANASTVFNYANPSELYVQGTAGDKVDVTCADV